MNLRRNKNNYNKPVKQFQCELLLLTNSKVFLESESFSFFVDVQTKAET